MRLRQTCSVSCVVFRLCSLVEKGTQSSLGGARAAGRMTLRATTRRAATGLTTICLGICAGPRSADAGSKTMNESAQSGQTCPGPVGLPCASTGTTTMLPPRHRAISLTAAPWPRATAMCRLVKASISTRPMATKDFRADVMLARLGATRAGHKATFWPVLLGS